MLQYFILSTPSFVSLFWAFALLIKKGKNYRTERVLAIDLLFCSVVFYIYGSFFVSDTDYENRYQQDIVYTFFLPMLYPLHMVYAKLLTDTKRFRWWLIPAFAPPFILTALTATGYLLMGKENSIIYARDFLFNYGEKHFPADYPLFKLQYFWNEVLFIIVISIQTLVAFIYFSYRIIKYRRQLKEFYSNPDEHFQRNFYFIFAATGIYSLLTFIAVLADLNSYNSRPLYVNTIFIFFAISSYILAYAGYHIQYTAEDFARQLAQADLAEEQNNNPLTDDCEERKSYNPRLVSLFTNLIEEDKIYLKSDLRLDEVAAMIQTNRCYISRLINEKYQCTFSEYINSCRIGYAQKLMQQNPLMKQEVVASESGFSHVASFSRTFKRVTGMTPKEWLKLQ